MIQALFNKPFDEQLEYFRQKGYLFSPNGWKDVWKEAHARAFTVARVTEMSVLQHVRNSLDRAMEKGESFDKWKKSLDLENWTKQRMEIVWRTNLSTSYHVGRYKQQQDLKHRRPWWQYRITPLVPSKRNRDSHKAHDGLVFSADHSFWNSNYPPNGFQAVLPGTMIDTIHGEKKIEDVKEGDLVLTHRNNYKPVYHFMEKYDKIDVYEMEMENGNVLKLTGDHPVLTDSGWKYAEDVVETDKVFEIQRKCSICGKILKPSQKNYCSYACSGKSKSRPRHNCIVCGGIVDDLRQKYCSRECYDKSRQPEVRHCIICDGVLKRNQKKVCSHVCNNKLRIKTKEVRYCAICNKQLAGRQKKYCSQKCLGVTVGNLRRVHRFCKFCGKELLQKWKKKNQHFCNARCQGEYNRKNVLICLNCGKKKQADKKNGININKERRFCSRRCYMAYKGETSIEKAVREWLTERDIMFIQEAAVGKHVVDFLLPIHSLVIEADGDYWHREGFRDEAEKNRDDIIRMDFGLSIVRIPECEIKAGDFSKIEFAIEQQIPSYFQTEIFAPMDFIEYPEFVQTSLFSLEADYVTRNADQKNNQEVLFGYGL